MLTNSVHSLFGQLGLIFFRCSTGQN